MVLKIVVRNSQNAGSLIRADRRFHELVVERFDVTQRRLVLALVFPRGDVRILLVVTFEFAIRVLVFLAEMSAAALLARERIATEEFAKLEEIGHATGL